jgi:hypothetical protein
VPARRVRRRTTARSNGAAPPQADEETGPAVRRYGADSGCGPQEQDRAAARLVADWQRLDISEGHHLVVWSAPFWCRGAGPRRCGTAINLRSNLELGKATKHRCNRCPGAVVVSARHQALGSVLIRNPTRTRILFPRPCQIRRRATAEQNEFPRATIVSLNMDVAVLFWIFLDYRIVLRSRLKPSKCL